MRWFMWVVAVLLAFVAYHYADTFSDLRMLAAITLFLTLAYCFDIKGRLLQAEVDIAGVRDELADREIQMDDLGYRLEQLEETVEELEETRKRLAAILEVAEEESKVALSA